MRYRILKRKKREPVSFFDNILEGFDRIFDAIEKMLDNIWRK